MESSGSKTHILRWNLFGGGGAWGHGEMIGQVFPRHRAFEKEESKLGRPPSTPRVRELRRTPLFC